MIFFSASWLCNQLQNASSAVEYVSWLTASIFSVLAVFTIFLSHQFQSHTSEMIKVTWKLKEAVTKKNSADFNQLLNDFSYFSNSPEVIKKSINTSRVVLYTLIPIWIVSCLAISLDIGAKYKGSFPIISIILIVITTSLFIFFSVELLGILKSLTNEGNKEIPIKSIEQLKDLNKISGIGFEVQNILSLEQPRFEILINEDEPFAKVRITRKYGFYNFYLLLTIEFGRNTVNIGTIIDTIGTEVNLKILAEEQESLNKFYESLNVCIARNFFTIIIGNNRYTFKSNYNEDENDSLPRKIEYTIGESVEWPPSNSIIKKLMENKFIIDVEMK